MHFSVFELLEAKIHGSYGQGKLESQGIVRSQGKWRGSGKSRGIL